MDTKQILGVIGIAVILIAVGFAIGLSVGDDGGKDGGNGGDTPSGTDKTIEYSLVVREYPDSYGFTVKFIGTARSWGVGERVDFSYRLYYSDDMDFTSVEANLRVVFPSYIDAVQVD